MDVFPKLSRAEALSWQRSQSNCETRMPQHGPLCQPPLRGQKQNHEARPSQAVLREPRSTRQPRCPLSVQARRGFGCRACLRGEVSTGGLLGGVLGTLPSEEKGPGRKGAVDLRVPCSWVTPQNCQGDLGVGPLEPQSSQAWGVAPWGGGRAGGEGALPS